VVMRSGISGPFDVTNRIVRESFRIFTTHTASVTGGVLVNNETDMYPVNWGSRGVAFADLYQLYRIVDMKVSYHFHPAYSNGATVAMYQPGLTLWMAAIYYGPKSTFTAPTSTTQFVDFPHLTVTTDAKSMVMIIPHRDLMARTRGQWYATAVTGGDDVETIQLTLEDISVTTNTVIVASIASIVIELEVEFTGAVDPALIPLKNIDQKDERNFPVKYRRFQHAHEVNDCVVERKETKEEFVKL